MRGVGWSGGKAREPSRTPALQPGRQIDQRLAVGTVRQAI
jgi:hypothetical protein